MKATLPSRGDRPVALLDGLSIALPLSGLVAGELLVFLGQYPYALWAHSLALVAATVAPVRADVDPEPFVALALVPLFRLVNLGIPVFLEPTIYWMPVVYGLFFSTFFVVSRADGLDITLALADLRWGSGSRSSDGGERRESGVVVSMGWRSVLRWAPAAVVAALVLAEFQYVLLAPAPLVPTLEFPQFLLVGVVMVGFVGLVEEILFRGLFQRIFQRSLGTLPGLLLASAVFGLVHSGYGLPEQLLFAGLVGVVLGLVYDWTDSLALVALFHGAFNVFLFAVYPINGLVFSLPVG